MLAGALIDRAPGLTRISEGLATLGAALDGVEAEHLRPLEPAVKAINAQFDIILSALPGHRRQGCRGGREEAAMTLWWIGDAVLLLVVAADRDLSAARVLAAAESDRAERQQITTRRRGGLQGSGRRGAASDHPGAGQQTVAVSRQLRRLTRRDRG